MLAALLVIMWIFTGKVLHSRLSLLKYVWFACWALAVILVSTPTFFFLFLSLVRMILMWVVTIFCNASCLFFSYVFNLGVQDLITMAGTNANMLLGTWEVFCLWVCDNIASWARHRHWNWDQTESQSDLVQLVFSYKTVCGVLVSFKLSRF